MPPAHDNLRTGDDGSYQRHDARHRKDTLSADEIEAGRYHLYVSLACPWAAGTLSALYLKGLESSIGVSIVHPTWGKTKPDDDDDTHHGWMFRKPGDPPVSNPLGHGSFECDDALIPDTIGGAKSIRDVYERAGDSEGPFTTPVLFDTKTTRIISNESRDILRMLNTDFAPLAKNNIDLYPSSVADELQSLNDQLVYPKVNNGVYRSGFAKSQDAYEKAVTELFEALETLEKRLGEHRFLSGDKFTWLDLRLYHTLVRFDPVYITYFKTNEKRLVDYPNLLAFTRDVYSIPEVKRATNLKHFKMHYFTSHPQLNTYAIIPVYSGPDLEVEHNRGPAGAFYSFKE